MNGIWAGGKAPLGSLEGVGDCSGGGVRERLECRPVELVEEFELAEAINELEWVEEVLEELEDVDGGAVSLARAARLRRLRPLNRWRTSCGG